MRITIKDLEAVVKRINTVAESPQEPYTRIDGKYHANIGCYVLDGAYGGYKLQRICSEGGGVTNITSGYIPKRELYSQMHAYLAGYEEALNQ